MAVAEASTAAQAAQQAVADGPDPVRIDRWRDQRTELGQSERPTRSGQNKRWQLSKNMRPKLARTLEQARATLRETGDRLDQARAVKQAEGLVAQLVAGEPCPVCRQPVHELPDHDLDTELDQLARTHTEAEAQKRKHEDALDEARTALANAEAAVESVTAQHDELVDKLSDAPDDEDLDHLAASADELAAAATKAQAELTAARQAEADLRDGTETKEKFKIEQDTQDELTRLTTKRDERCSQRDDLAQRLTGKPDEETLEKDIALAEQLAATRREAQSAETEAQEAEQVARKALEGLTETERQARNEFAKTRDGFAALEPPTPGASLVQDWQALDKWASRLAEKLIPEIDTANEHVNNTETQEERAR